ncbi:MAG: Gldg family protein, partial [Planctomycetota bacterium]
VTGTVAGLSLWLLSVPVTISSLDAAGDWLSKIHPFGFLAGARLGEAAAVFSHGSHLTNLARGLFDAGDAAYFVLATGFLLWLTGIALESERLGVRTLWLAALAGRRFGLSGRLRAHAASILAATFLLFGCAIFLQRATAAGRWQADLTQEKVFTLSDATGKILKSLEGDPVKVTWYLSENLPASMRDLPRRTLDRLEGMSRLAPGRLRFEIVRPEKDERIRARLQEDRVTPASIREETFDSVSYREIYTHMAVNYHDRSTYYMRFGQDEELEYSLLRAVLWLRLGRETPRIAALIPPPHGDTGVIVPGQVPAAQDPFEAVIDFLKASFRVERLDPRASGRIPEGTQALLLVKPRGAGPLDALPDRWRFEVERYLAEGGTVLAFMPAIQMGYWQAENQQTWKSGETLSDLLEPLGIGLPPIFLADNQMHALAVNTEDRIQNIPMPLVLNVSPDQMDSRSALTRSLGGLILPFATPILVDPDNAARKKAGIQVTRLAWSSNQSGTRPFSANIYAEKNVPLYFTPPKRNEWREGQSVAVLLEGRFPFPFEGLPVPAWPKASKPPPADPGATPGKAPVPPPDPEAGRVARADSRPGRLLLVSCADMLSTDFIQRFQQDYEMTNLEFLENALLAFTLGDDLLQVRRKAARNRPLAEIEPPPFSDFVVAKPGSPVTTTAEVRRNDNPDKKPDAPPFRDFVTLFTSEPVPEELAAAARSAGGMV